MFHGRVPFPIRWVSIVAFASSIKTGIPALCNFGSVRSDRNYYTVVTCLTAFGIFQHGGFGVPHVFAIVTLVVLAGALVVERVAPFGNASPYAATVGYSFALFLHFVPATVETLIRLPTGAPYLSHPEDPKAQPIIGFFFLVFLAGAALQVMRMRRRPEPASRAANPAL